jgi:glycosyltransferase involved in cell wall biosynthesis
MNILYLCADHGIPISGRLGSSTHVREFCRALNNAGHHVTLVATNPGDAPDDIADLDAHFIDPPRSKKLGYDLRNILHNRRFFRLAKKIARQNKCQAIYERHSLYSWAGMRLARKMKIPRLLEVNAFLSTEHAKKLHFRRFARAVEKHITRRAHAVAVISEPVRQEALALGVEEEKLFIMPTAVNTQAFRPDPQNRQASRKRWQLQDRFVVGYVGGLAAWHGIDMFYELAEKLKNITPRVAFLILGGKPHQLDDHRQRVKDAGLENTLIFAGSMPHHEVPRAMAAMDTAIIPDNLSWGCSTKMFEYQAMALPPLAPRYPAFLDNITHDTDGILFEPRDIQAILDAIIKLADNSKKTEEMGNEARKRVEREHAWECNVRRTMERYQSLL